MRSSWIPCLLAVGLLASAPCAAVQRGKVRPPGELVNLFLAPGNAQWLVGPIAWLASEEEIQAYLAITDEAAAERFIDDFWARREPVAGAPGLTARRQYEARAEEADRLFTEATLRGRHTDRGTIFILYGPPDEKRFKPARSPRVSRYRARPLGAGHGQEVRWRYDKGKLGLDGRSPKRTYRFIQRNGTTRFADPSRLP